MRKRLARQGKAGERDPGPHRHLDPQGEPPIADQQSSLPDLQGFLGEAECKEAFKHASKPTCFVCF